MSDDIDAKKFALRTEIPIRWRDMDAMGHVNNSVFFTYFEQARVAWLATTGWNANQGDGGPVVVNAACTFMRPLVYPGAIEVRLLAGSPGRSSIPTFYEIHRTDTPEVLCARGEATMVWVSHASGRAIELPVAIRRLIAALPAAT